MLPIEDVLKYGLCINNVSTLSQVQMKAIMPNFVKYLYVP